ncbi:MAG: hypothetical protein Q9170_004230 [Blastenia crenularia]
MSPATMGSSSALDRHLSSADEAQLAEALELRRKQIDREIAEFKADKEREFRKFEKRLRSEKRDAERQKILQCEREVDKANALKRKGSKDLSLARTGRRSGVVVFDDDTRANGVRFGGATEIPDSEKENVKDGAASKDQRPVHEREEEFRGLFTPTYLPLLGGRKRDEDLQEDIANTVNSKPERVSWSDRSLQSSAPAASIGKAPISGSAPLTPATPCRLSSNDPRKRSMSERRSSSRSDTSVSSLRSSLRDPKQTRSPKRVLFSIDNVVVSPSTSPTMQRKMNPPRRSNNEQAEMLHVVERSTEGTSSWRNNVSAQSRKSALTNIPTINGHPVDSTKLSHPAAHIGRPSTSPSMGGDGFEHVGGAEEDDDLFAFDEDVRYRDEDGKGGEGEEEINNADMEHSPAPELPTSSPYAGSLPIEIRWPGRKDPRG